MINLKKIMDILTTKIYVSIYFALCLIFISFQTKASTANQLGFAVGATVNFDYQAYVHDDRDPLITVLPTFFYDNDRFYLEGDEAGFYLYKNQQNELRINAYYDGTQFDPIHAYHGIHTRKWSVMAGASYMRITPYGGFKLQVGSDVLSRSKGTVITASYLAELKHGAWTWYPELGVNWNNQAYNQYYFGVTNEESQYSGVKAYQPKSAFQPYFSLNNIYQVNDRWDIISGVEINYLTDEMYQSPFVHKHLDVEPFIGFLFHF